MVSIPDFSRWGRLVQSEKSMSIQEKYDKHREEEVIKCAKESGYFLNITQQYLIETFSDSDDSKTKDIRNIQHANLERYHIRNIGAIEFCRNIKYLNLSGNYLTNIDPLVSCQMLIKLDLSNNQLENLPRTEFWMSMRYLQILYAHDNPIGQVDAIAGLSGCRSLTILTLYDSPISLKRNYRHHVVNSIWTLKALDYHIISDEEIIEDASFKTKRFKTLSQQLRIKPYRCVSKDDSVMKERDSVVRLLVEVNNIMAHNSPVLIIQRYIKGYLIRKKLGVKSKSDKLQSISKLKALPPIPTDSTKQSDIHECFEQCQEELHQDPSKSDIPTTFKREISSTTIIKGPSTKCEESVDLREELLPYAASPPPPVRQLLESEEYGGRSPEYAPQGLAFEPPGRKTLHIDLKQLNATQMEAFEAHTNEMDEAMSDIRQTKGGPLDTTQRSDKTLHGPASTPTSASIPQKKATMIKMRSEESPLLPYSEIHSPTRIRDIYQAFEFKDRTPHENTDQLPETPFRLVGRKEGVQQIDPVMDMIIRRAEAGHMIREAESEYHRAKFLQRPPQIKKFPHQTNDQRLFGRVQCTMGTLLLQKWDRMDRDILLQDLASKYTENTVATRNAEAQAKRNIGIWRDDQKAKMRNDRRLEKRDNERQIHHHKNKDIEEHQLGRVKRDKMIQYKEYSKRDREFAQNFRGQHNSVSKALMKHDRYALGDEKLQARSNFVKSIRENEKDKLDTIRKYLDLQAKERHKEMSQNRQEIESKVLQEANQRLLEAHTRVEHLRNLKRFFQELPTVSNNYPEIADPRTDRSKPVNRFEVEATYHLGRVGKHPTIG